MTKFVQQYGLGSWQDMHQGDLKPEVATRMIPALEAMAEAQAFSRL